MKTVRMIVMALAMGVVGVLMAAPTDNVIIKETAPATLKNVKWHERDEGWLFTCRFTVPSNDVIKPVCYLEFTGFIGDGEEREVIWTKTKTIFRKKLKRDEFFVRMWITDFPEKAEGMEIKFINSPKA